MAKKSPKDTQSRCWSVTIPAQPDDVDLDVVKEMGVDFSPRLKAGDSTPHKVEFLFR